jgi:pyridinium-3,5-biscarboxylic acid mononucleotide sulfurtransferase
MGWGKREVRQEARRRGLENWDAPSDACLASRIRHGQPVEAELLARIEAAESAVRARGYRRVRVRVDGERVRVEVDIADLGRLFKADERLAVERAVILAGFPLVELDPRGYRPRAGA